MASQTQVVGIIEIDTDPTLAPLSDEHFGAALRQLRCEEPESEGPLPYPADPFACWEVSSAPSSADRLVLLTADLRQLHTDLENELAQFIDRLLTAS